MRLRSRLSCHGGTQYHARCNTSLVPDVEMAITRMREGFAFVGLTSHWGLSICLLHAWFAHAPCLRVEFDNTRPTTAHTTKLSHSRNHTSAAVLAEVMTVDDPFDTALLGAVEERFRSEWRRMRLSAVACNRICPEAPIGAFDGPLP